MIKLEVIGQGALTAAIKGLDDNLVDFQDEWVEISRVFDQIETRLFDSEGATGESGSWTPLSRQYGRWKNVHYPGKRILERMGPLRSSLTNASDPNSITEINAGTLTRGTRIAYAGTHHFGTHYVVRRPVIDLTEDDQLELAEKFLEVFGGKAQALGFIAR